VENAGVPGKAAEGPRYAVTLAAFKGDWWQAARMYREWAVKQKWCAKGRIRERADYPKAMSDIDAWLLANGDPRTISNIVVRGTREGNRGWTACARLARCGARRGTFSRTARSWTNCGLKKNSRWCRLS